MRSKVRIFMLLLCSLALFSCQPVDLEKELGLGTAAARKNDWKTALAKAELCLDNVPSSADAWRERFTGWRRDMRAVVLPASSPSDAPSSFMRLPCSSRAESRGRRSRRSRGGENTRTHKKGTDMTVRELKEKLLTEERHDLDPVEREV